MGLSKSGWRGHCGPPALLWAAAWLFLLAAGCSRKVVECRWAEGDIRVDGKGGDWSEVNLNHDGETGLSFGLSNDDRHLFLMIATRDHQLARELEHRGVTVWFDIHGRGGKEFGFRYVNTEHPDLLWIAGKAGSPEREEARPAVSSGELRHWQPWDPEGQFFLLVGQEAPRQLPESGPRGPEVAAAFAEGVVCYEFSIPLRGTPARLGGLKVSPGQELELGFEIGPAGPNERSALLEQGRRAPEGAGRGMPGGRRGMGVPGGAGPPPGRPPGEMGGNSPPGGGHPGVTAGEAGGPWKKGLEGKEIWLTIRLAENGSHS